MKETTQGTRSALRESIRAAAGYRPSRQLLPAARCNWRDGREPTRPSVEWWAPRPGGAASAAPSRPHSGGSRCFGISKPARQPFAQTVCGPSGTAQTLFNADAH